MSHAPVQAQDILHALDHCDDYSDFSFINLEHPYIYTADCRLNLFRDDEGHWAIVSEVLGFSNRAVEGWCVTLEIRYFGNALYELSDDGDNRPYNYYTVYPVDSETLEASIENEALLPEATHWTVRGVDVPLSHEPGDYSAAGIELRDDESGEIACEEVLRLSVTGRRDLFRATNEELYRGIADSMRKVLVLDEWHHRSFSQNRSAFDDPAFVSRFDRSIPSVDAMIEEELEKTRAYNAELWKNRPSSYETWQQIADVLATGDTSLYKPTLAANTDWRNWPEGGAM